MKTSKISRRKFLTGLGLAAGATAVMPAYTFMSKSKNVGRRSGNALASSRRPAIHNKLGALQPVKFISRPIGTSRLPLASRPV